MRRVLRDWIPRGAVREGRKLLGAMGVAQWEYAPAGWTGIVEKGWEDSSVAKTQLAKWDTFSAAVHSTGPLGINHEAPADAGAEDIIAHNVVMSFGYVLALSARESSTPSVLDWGGGAGHFGELARALLPHRTPLRYCVHDLPSLMRIGRELAPWIDFIDSSEECFRGRYDLVYAGSSLQYAPEWRHLLRSLAGSSQHYLFIARSLFVDPFPSYVTIQRPRGIGYDTEYLGWVFQASELIAEANEGGFDLVREFIMGEGPFIRRAPAQPSYRGYLFRRRFESSPT